MTYTKGVLTGGAAVLFLLGVAAGGYWLVANPPTAAAPPKPAAPASVPKLLKEEQIASVTLTPEAEVRLGIAVAPVESRSTLRSRVYGGEVMVPLGRTIPVAAPLGGTLRAPEKGLPTPGSPVKKGDAVLFLSPLLAPDARASLASFRIEADGQVETARTSADLARLTLERVRRLQGAVTQQEIETAKAAFDIAHKMVEVAQSRRDAILRITAEVERGTGVALVIESPADGVLRAVSVTPGQSVPAGATLFEVIDPSTVWVRVAVYVGELADLAPGEPVAVGALCARPGPPAHEARPVVAPPSANAAAGTIDLYYELANPGCAFAPGHRVAVAVPLRDRGEEPTVPWSAVLHDIHGGTWVYERTAPLTYVRRRVEISHVDGDRAVLAKALLPGTLVIGTPVVTAGAIELFGTEVGFSK